MSSPLSLLLLALVAAAPHRLLQAWPGSAWPGSAWPGLARLGLARLGLVWRRLRFGSIPARCS
ncbi:hypothetical protein AB0C06_05185 [Micromonospora inaquosa]|uniref:hypothetical protein n=1 Tax=Micromonospora inaquosa TaxID=2203716 RepID=UPI0034045255